MSNSGQREANGRWIYTPSWSRILYTRSDRIERRVWSDRKLCKQLTTHNVQGFIYSTHNFLKSYVQDIANESQQFSPFLNNATDCWLQEICLSYMIWGLHNTYLFILFFFIYQSIHRSHMFSLLQLDMIENAVKRVSVRTCLLSKSSSSSQSSIMYYVCIVTALIKAFASCGH